MVVWEDMSGGVLLFGAPAVCYINSPLKWDCEIPQGPTLLCTQLFCSNWRELRIGHGKLLPVCLPLHLTLLPYSGKCLYVLYPLSLSSSDVCIVIGVLCFRPFYKNQFNTVSIPSLWHFTAQPVVANDDKQIYHTAVTISFPSLQSL